MFFPEKIRRKKAGQEYGTKRRTDVVLNLGNAGKIIFNMSESMHNMLLVMSLSFVIMHHRRSFVSR